MAMTVKRDPFARGEYKRFCESNDARNGSYGPWCCAWCGQKPKRLYSYVWWSDDKQEPMDDNGYWFCNFNCFSSYNY